MIINSKLVSLFTKPKHLHPKLIRNYVTLVQKELEVPTFCDVHVDVPYNVKIKPLDVHKYHNCDKLLIQVEEGCEKTLEYDVYGNRVTIFDKSESKASDTLINIKAPVKANLYINAQKNIKVGYFHGDKAYFESFEGNIEIDKYQGDSIYVTTHEGGVNIKDYIQASDIIVNVTKKGDIKCGRLQSASTELKTKKGNISVLSSYSPNNIFESEKGNMDLHNVHKSCKVVAKHGHINLTGFDGKLVTNVEKGTASIQLSRLTEDSEINILDGILNLKLSDACQDSVQIKLNTKDWKIADNVKLTASNHEGTVVLTPDLLEQHTLVINCPKGQVNIESGSWKDMIKLKLQK